MANKMKYTGVFLVFVMLVVSVFALPAFAKGTHNQGPPFEELWDAIDSLWDAIDEIELTPGPPGPQGEQGPAGPKGDTGDTGPAGTTSWIDGTGQVTTNNNVGIGTTSPDRTLDVGPDSGLNTISINKGDAYGGAMLEFCSGGSGFASIYANPNEDLEIRIEPYGSTRDMYFVTSGNQRRMTIDGPTGNVGIGTTRPARKLHVNDVMRLEPISTAPSSPSEGDIYMNGTSHKLMVYNGTTWQACW